eukprot:Gb_24578 [translate_table: standard]
MSKCHAEASVAGPKYIELREHDEEALRARLRKKLDTHPCNAALKSVGLKDFFLMPNLAYDASLVTEPRYTHFPTHLMAAITGVAQGNTEKLEEIGISATTQFHGQRMELRQVEDAKEGRRKEGKFKVPIPPLSEYLTSRIRLEWPETNPNNFINLEYEDRWKIFEEGLEKKDYELFNHEQWRPTFMANVIDILVRDLVHKIKDLEYGESNETKKAKDQAAEAKQNIQFIQNSVIYG